MIKQISRKLRKNQTKSEKILWQTLRGNQLGIKFRRQHPIKFNLGSQNRLFVADFYCASLKLIVELDGQIHLNQVEYDEYRTYLIEIMGYSVIRFSNDKIILQIDKVLEKIKDLATSPPSPLSTPIGRGEGEFRVGVPLSVPNGNGEGPGVGLGKMGLTHVQVPLSVPNGNGEGPGVGLGKMGLTHVQVPLSVPNGNGEGPGVGLVNLGSLQ